MAAPSGGTPRRAMPKEWTGLTTPAGFERCVRATLRELYGYAALLEGRDRAGAERLVADVYRSLFRAARAGHVESVTLGALRSAARRTWLDEHRTELAVADEVSRQPASTIAELSAIERAVLVFRHVNGMSVQRTAMEIGRGDREVAALSTHTVRRLRGTDDTSGAWLRAYLGPSVTPTAGLVDRIVRQLGDRGTAAPPPAADAPMAEAAPWDEPTQPLEVVVPDADEPTQPVDVVAPDVDVVDDGEETTQPVGVVVPDADDGDDGEEPTQPVGVVVPDADDGDDAEEPTQPVAVVVPDADEPPPDDESDADAVATTELPVVAGPAGDDAAEPSRPDATRPDPADRTAIRPLDLGTRRDAPRDPAPPDDAGTGLRVVDATDAEEAQPLAPTSRPRWLLAVGLVLVAALVVALAWLALRGDEPIDSSATPDGPVDESAEEPTATTLVTDDTTNDTTNDTTGEDPATSGPPLETTVPTPVAPPTSTATAIAGERSSAYEPACDARIGDADPALLGVPAGPFGPVATVPAVAVAVPQVRAETGTLTDPAISVVRDGDGMLVLLEAVPDVSDVTDRVVAYVGLDGTAAWVRCLTGDANVLVSPTAEVPLAVGLPTDPADPEGGTTWSPFDLDDGELAEPYEGITERAINASLRLAGSTGVTEPTVSWQFADGRWVLTGLDGDGGVVWTDPDAEAPFGDSASFVIHQSAGVAVVATCAERPESDVENCSVPGPILGYDVATGDVRWSIRGDLAPVVADGFALVRSGAGWDLIDVADGTPVDGQQWDDPATFEQSAGLESESVWVDLVDGVLVAAHGDRIELWLPEAFAAPTADVSIT